MPKNIAAALGALTGLVSLVAMVRLVSGAFTRTWFEPMQTLRRLSIVKPSTLTATAGR